MLLFLFQVCGPRERKVEGGIHHRLPSPPLCLQSASLQAPVLAAWLTGWLSLYYLPFQSAHLLAHILDMLSGVTVVPFWKTCDPRIVWPCSLPALWSLNMLLVCLSYVSTVGTVLELSFKGREITPPKICKALLAETFPCYSRR